MNHFNFDYLPLSVISETLQNTYLLSYCGKQNLAVSVWNSLPDSVVSAESVNSFKSRLDIFWSMHDFVYDYRASPLAAGS